MCGPRRWWSAASPPSRIVDQQQARVDQLKASIEADAAAIETAQTQFDYTFIKAPSDGRIGVRLVDPGNLVHANDTRPIASLVLTQPSAVMFTLPVQMLDDLREAMARGPVEVHGLRPGRPPPVEHRQAPARSTT